MMNWLNGCLFIALGISAFAWDLLLGVGATISVFSNNGIQSQSIVTKALALLPIISAMFCLAATVGVSLLFLGIKFSSRNILILLVATVAISLSTLCIELATKSKLFPFYTQWTVGTKSFATILFCSLPNGHFNSLRSRPPKFIDYILLFSISLLSSFLYWFSLAGMSQLRVYSQLGYMTDERAWLPFLLLEIFSGGQETNILPYVALIQFTFMYALFVAISCTLFVGMSVWILFRRSQPTKTI